MNGKFRKARAARGISQGQLAKKSGVSIYTIRSYDQELADMQNANYRIVADLARALECEPADIVGE